MAGPNDGDERFLVSSVFETPPPHPLRLFATVSSRLCWR